jgi:hypothetical protein
LVTLRQVRLEGDSMDAHDPTSEPEEFDYNAMHQWIDSKPVGEYDSGGGGEYTPPPVGQYGLKLIKKHPTTEVKPEFNDSGKPKYQAQFEFEIVEAEEPEWLGHIIKQYYTLSLNEKSNLRPVVEALTGRPLRPTDRMGWADGTKTGPTGETITVVGIGNKTMRATITHRTNQRGLVLPKIMGPIPWKPRKPKTTTPTPEPEAVPAGGIEIEEVPF